jgi:hypothetical protein
MSFKLTLVRGDDPRVRQVRKTRLTLFLHAEARRQTSARRVREFASNNQPLRGGRDHGSTCVVMILPQVHLRKPCYDFTFL